MKVLVTGGTGFLGNALVKSLLNDGHEIISVARGSDQSLANLGAAQVSIDVGDLGTRSSYSKLCDALVGVEAVFHIAAKVAMWGAKADFFRINVEGTSLLLKASKAAGVTRFIYTSSPSVIASGSDLSGVDESVPYPAHYEAYYPQTKALAEQAVLAAHTTEFRTIALRPHLIFGPGDTNLVPTIIAKARAGRLAIIGAGKNLVDFSYIDDCVAGHRAAEQALLGDATVGGRPYFLSQGQPMVLWDFINLILSGIGQQPVTKRVSRGLAATIATGLEAISRITGREPALTRFLVAEMATEHYFDLTAATTLLHYAPRVTMEVAIERTIDWLGTISKPSKA